MKIITPDEWQFWCTSHQIPVRQHGWMRPDLNTDLYSRVKVPYDRDAGRKVFLSRNLYALVAPQEGSQTLILLDDWGVAPSREHEPLFTRFRQALGESRTLIEAPGHLVEASEPDDAVSIIATALLFSWDCYGITASGRDAFYFSHDEYCYFGSRDPEFAAQVSKEVEANFQMHQ